MGSYRERMAVRDALLETIFEEKLRPGQDGARAEPFKPRSKVGRDRDS
jgi:hypothetical protein